MKDIKSLLEENPDWTDEDGNSLLHLASESGDMELVNICLRGGVKTLVYNNENVPARDVARAWGHDAISTLLDDRMKQERLSSPLPLPCNSLKEICEKHLLHYVARRGMTGELIRLMKKTKETLTAKDLLDKSLDGESVIFRICQQGQLEELMTPELWLSNLNDFLSALETVPKIYQSGIDIQSFVSHVRQENMKRRAPIQLKKGPSPE